MRKLFLIFMLLFCSILVSAAEELKPLADFAVHTIVTFGPKVYEGKKIRAAVLTYGELEKPTIFIEAIKIEEGYPIQSKALWRKNIDATEKIDSTGDFCQGPEGAWSCFLENLRWEDSSLNYEIKNSKGNYSCSIEVNDTEDLKVNYKCSKLQ